MKFSVALALAATALAAPQNGQGARKSDLRTTDKYLFKTSLPKFLDIRETQEPAQLDWSTNGCTASPDEPLGFQFIKACYRHDFGYRNYRTQGRFTEVNRAKIDRQFKRDLEYVCRKDHGNEYLKCWGMAQAYYQVVSAAGGSGTVEPTAE